MDTKAAIIILAMFAVLFLAGCENVDLSKVSDSDLDRLAERAIVCESPYIRFGTDCCLDRDTNSICDNDEQGSTPNLPDEKGGDEPIEVIPPNNQPNPDAQPKKDAPGQIAPPQPGNGDADNRVIDMPTLMDDDPILGDEDAMLTIIEWADYECPFCIKFHDDNFEKLKEEYIETGKVKFVFRDFPLSNIHPTAQKAAEASECADDQGKFWEMHKRLLNEGTLGGVESFKRYAEQLDLNAYEFAQCLDTDKHRQEVLDDYQDGQKAGVDGTPSFLINGEDVVGAVSYEQFKRIIEDLSKPEVTEQTQPTQPTTP